MNSAVLPAAWADRANGALKRVPVLPLYFLALAPGAWDFWLAISGAAGPDPVRAIELSFGSWALIFLIASLAVTPLRERAGLNLLRFRRMLGLTAFWYALAHFSVWLILDRQLAWGQIWIDLTRRPWVIAGMAALLALLPLALTSSNRAISALGAQRWRTLHRLAYVGALAVILHYLWLVKSWTFEPLAYAAVTAALLAYRLLPKPERGRRA